MFSSGVESSVIRLVMREAIEDRVILSHTPAICVGELPFHLFPPTQTDNRCPSP